MSLRVRCRTLFQSGAMVVKLVRRSCLAFVAAGREAGQSRLWYFAAAWVSLAVSRLTGYFCLAGDLACQYKGAVFGFGRSRRGDFAVSARLRLGWVTARCCRSAVLAVLLSGPCCSPFGGPFLVGLPVFFGARRAPGLTWDCGLVASDTQAEFFGTLTSCSLDVAVLCLALRPLMSCLFVLSAFLPPQFQFLWGWSGSWSLWCFGFLGCGFAFGCLASRRRLLG